MNSCGPAAEGGMPTATGRVHNTTPHRSNDFIRIHFVDPAGTVIGEGMEAVGRVGAGATAVWVATSKHAASEPSTCQLAGVTRTVLIPG